MLIWMWGASLSGDPPQGTAQQFQKNRDLYFKKKLNKSPALLIGECYPHPHPHPPIVSLACTPIPPRPQGYLQHGTIEAWGGGHCSREEGVQGRSPPRGVPQDNTTSTRKVANQAEMGTSFQGPYIQTLHLQQGSGGPDGTGKGTWWASGPAQD